MATWVVGGLLAVAVIAIIWKMIRDKLQHRGGCCGDCSGCTACKHE